MKLKSLLEGYAWERKPGKPLPTLAEVQAEYRKKLTEDDDLTTQSLSSLNTICEKYKSELNSAFNDVQIGSEDAKNVMKNNVTSLMTAICSYVSDIQSLYKQYPDFSIDDLVIENAKQILYDDILNNLEF